MPRYETSAQTPTSHSTCIFGVLREHRHQFAIPVSVVAVTAKGIRLVFPNSHPSLNVFIGRWDLSVVVEVEG